MVWTRGHFLSCPRSSWLAQDNRLIVGASCTWSKDELGQFMVDWDHDEVDVELFMPRHFFEFSRIKSYAEADVDVMDWQ